MGLTLGKTWMRINMESTTSNSSDRTVPSIEVSFSFRDRFVRVLWRYVWLLLASWTPRQFNAWRILLLRLFGANVAKRANVYSSAIVWWPGNLYMEDGATLGPRVICYNMARICLGRGSLVSQGAQLCTGSHRIDDPEFSLISRPITIGPNAWIAANAFVGPGVEVAEGAVLGACAVAFSDLKPWTVWVGNPARCLRKRSQPDV